MKKQYEKMNAKAGFYLSNLLKSLPMTDYNEVQNLGLPCPVKERQIFNFLYTLKNNTVIFSFVFGAYNISKNNRLDLPTADG